MKSFYLCLVLAAAVQATLGANNKLYGTFSAPGVDPSLNASFFEIPRQLRDATNWSLDSSYAPTVVNGSGFVWSIYCRNKDYHVCAIFDLKGSIAGLQISMSVADFKKSGGPVGKNLVQKRVAGTEVFSKIFLFPDKSAEQTGGRWLLDSTLTAPNGIRFYDNKNKTHTIEVTEDGNKGNLFVKQSCVPNMGRHYFFNISKEFVNASCDNVDKTFGLYSDATHQLVGAGVIFFGKSTPLPNGRQWMEYPPGNITRFIAPGAAECVHANAQKFGLTSFHFYVSEKPWTIKCPIN